MDKPMQGIQAQICGVVHEVSTPERGPAVVTVRVSHGKDKKTDQWKPSSWFRVKVFAGKLDFIKHLTSEAIVTVSVYGATEEWIGKDGQKRSDKAWYLQDIEVHEPGRMPAGVPNLRNTVRQAAESDDVPF